MKMRTFVLLASILATAISFAGVEAPFKQFAEDDYVETLRADQHHTPAQLISLKVTGGSDVWLSNYFRQDHTEIPDLHGNVFDMGSDQKYGYIFKNDLTSLSLEKGSYGDLIHWSNGETTEITYIDNTKPDTKQTATGYFLDYFEDDAEIYLVMTALEEDGHETVDSYQYVYENKAHEDTTLLSRKDNRLDHAGNVIVNFDIDSEVHGNSAREFVAVYDDTAIERHTIPAGGPLPGLLFVGLLSMGTVFGASRMKKRS